MPAKPLLSYTRAVTGDQASRLRQVLERDNFDFVPKEHTYYAATNGKVNVPLPWTSTLGPFLYTATLTLPLVSA